MTFLVFFISAVFLMLLFTGILLSALSEFNGATIVLLIFLAYWLWKDIYTTTQSRRRSK